jgi:hypothetical protein
MVAEVTVPVQVTPVNTIPDTKLVMLTAIDMFAYVGPKTVWAVSSSAPPRIGSPEQLPEKATANPVAARVEPIIVISIR